MQLGEEGGAPLAEVVDDGLLALGERRRFAAGRRGWEKSGGVVGEVECDPAVAFAERLDADPDHLACRGDRIEIGRIVRVDACREDLAFEDRRGDRRPLQLLDRVEQRIGTVPALRDSLPGRRKPSEHGLIDRLHFVPQLRERAPPDQTEDARVGPFAAAPSGPELAFDQPSLRREADQHRFGRRLAEGVACRKGGCAEGRVRSGISEREIADRIGNRFEERFGQTDRQWHAERVAIRAASSTAM